MRKSTFLVAAVGLAAILVAGGIFASNMGMKLNYALTGPGGGQINGVNTIALPFNQQTNIGDALDLFNDIDAASPGDVLFVSRYVKSTNGLEDYNGTAGTAFPIVPGEGYRVQVNAPVNYIVVGSHDPGLIVNLSGPAGGQVNGVNTYAYPYHSTSADALDLFNEVDAASPGDVLFVSQYVKTTNGIEDYNGQAGTAFPLLPGESYRIQVSTDVSFVPSHF
jgi:hypothetical protein